MGVDTFKFYQAKIRFSYKQTIVVSSRDTFPARFPNIFVNYPLGQMKVGDKLWTNWNKAPMRSWQMYGCRNGAKFNILKLYSYSTFIHSCSPFIHVYSPFIHVYSPFVYSHSTFVYSYSAFV